MTDPEDFKTAQELARKTDSTVVGSEKYDTPAELEEETGDSEIGPDPDLTPSELVEKYSQPTEPDQEETEEE